MFRTSEGRRGVFPATGPGSGLGLAIAREIAAAHGERIEIRDGKDGKGPASS